MIAWIIILALLLMLLALPVGIDAAYERSGSFLKLKIGPMRKILFPRQHPKKPRKENSEPPEQTQEESGDAKKNSLKLSPDDILTLLEIALRALRRFRRHLSIDRFRLRWIAAASDPYDAVLQYGRVNAAVGALQPKAHNALKIREEDILIDLDLEAQRPEITARLVMSIQIWEILLIAACAGGSGLCWFLKKKRAERAAAESAAVGKEFA